MPQNNDRKERDFSQYDALSTEELSEILRLDSEAPEGNGLDIDTLLYITGVLAERKETTNTGKTAQEAWSSFQQNYLESEDACPAVTEEKKPAKTGKPWIRRMIAAILVVVILVAVPLSVKALNWEDIRNTVVQWAKETFSFIRGDRRNVDGPGTGDSREHDSLQEALKLTGQEFNLIPTWIPEGYVLEKIDIDKTPFQKDYIALYVKDEQFYNICVRVYIESDPQRIEANENVIDTIVTADNEYHILSNNGLNKVVWSQDSYECSISGDLTIDELKQMINSIPEG